MAASARHTCATLLRMLASPSTAAPARRGVALVSQRPCPVCRTFSTTQRRRQEEEEAAPAAPASSSSVPPVRPAPKVPGYLKARLGPSCKDLLTSCNDDVVCSLQAVYALRTQELRERAIRTNRVALYRKSAVELELQLVASQLGVESSLLPAQPFAWAPSSKDDDQAVPYTPRVKAPKAPPAPKPLKPKSPRKARKLKLPIWDPNEPAPYSPWKHLPPLTYWPDTFSKGRGFLNINRFFVHEEKTANKIVDRLGLGDGTGEKHTIVELYSGPGTLTRTLLEHPAVEKVIAIEDTQGAVQFLEALKTDESVKGGAPNDRLFVHEGNPYKWSAYSSVIASGGFSHLEGRIPGEKPGEFMDVRQTDLARKTHNDPSWKVPAPITVVAQMPSSVHCEQLFAQLIAAIPVRQWLFAYGRVKLAFITTEAVANRVQAQPGSRSWARLGVLAEALSDIKCVIPANELEPLDEHFFPPNLLPRRPVKARHLHMYSEAKHRMCMLILEPKLKPLLDHDTADAFQFILRNLMVVRSKTVNAALKRAAPGAHNLLRRLHPAHPDMQDRPDEAIDPETRVQDLKTLQFMALARAFDKWPFRPKHLFEEGRLAEEDR